MYVEAMTLLIALAFGVAALGSALTALPTLVVEWRRSDAPEVLFYVGTDERVVSLTIDDGPSPATPEILDVLAENGAHATFFVIGDRVREHPDLVDRLVAEGHELGHHMMVDEPSIELSPEAFREQLEEMDRILDGYGGSTLFRPASGWTDDRMVEEASRLGYRTVLGSVYPFDAQHSLSGLSTWYIRQLVDPGAILVLHEGAERGPRTAEVLRTLLPELRARGIRVVPVSQLVALERSAAR